MDLLQSVVLGFIQGVTEWLPISSTGHLRLAEHFFNLTVPSLFDVTLHVGTLLVILIYFRGTIKNVLYALWRRNFQSEDGKLIVPIIVGSIPTAVIAVLFGNQLDAYFNSLLFLGVGFIVSAVVLFASKFGVEHKGSVSMPAALLIGTMQGISIIPSISRSGFTIAVALLVGVKKEVAYKYSFLLSVPAVIGALGLTLYQEQNAFSLAGISGFDVAAALLVTVAVSFLALRVLWKTLAAKKFYLFFIYCLIIGLALVVLSLLGY
ncbi:MAG: undecaprenyl-diphosphate phosphatase [Candidatus Bathyarchaeota archaeon]|nr:undecaprenyl-diphosphate phosphatase [Candidatus Bathyarchaeota archaeon]